VVRIAFFGTPAFAVPSLEALVKGGEHIVVVVTQPDRPRGRGQKVIHSSVKATAIKNKIPVLQPNRAKDQDFHESLTLHSADLGVVVAYGQILPETILRLPPKGIINVHASLLPRYRGAAPIQRAVMAGENNTGITMIRLIREMDAGPILSQATYPISDDENSEDLEQALSLLGAKLLLSTVRSIAAGRTQEQPQDHSLATFAPLITKEDGRINWRDNALTLHNLVRGLLPRPRAFTCLGGTRLLVLRTSVELSSSATGKPGEILTASGDQLQVCCGQGTVLAIHEIQPEGKRVLPIRAFLAGHPINTGMFFERTK